MQNTQTSLRQLAQVFHQLPAAEGTLSPGDYRAEMTGPLWLRKTARPMLAMIGFSNWHGKRIGADGSAINLKSVNGRLIEFLPMSLKVSASRLDGQAVWLLSYPADTHFPVRYMADELRRLDPHTLLGLSYTDLPGLGKTGLPFLLHRPQ